MKTKKVLLGLVLVLMPLFTACMCFGMIATLHDYGCHTHVLGFVSVAVLGVLSLLPIREIYQYTGWHSGCVLSGGLNGSVALFCHMIASYVY
ncbi:iron transporter [Helicobacter salomonis]|uniref:iron transporter n=1 Tax=Helicobacter salomonis TaxID=56878 RepID=UPI000CF10F09|nr:iron transporter [Helicobacter salomonis]